MGAINPHVPEGVLCIYVQMANNLEGLWMRSELYGFISSTVLGGGISISRMGNGRFIGETW